MAWPQTWMTLNKVLEEIRYTRDEFDGRRFELRTWPEQNYAVLYIFTMNPNTYDPDQIRHTRHEFIVPVATYNESAWVRWVFDRIASIELHETAESFQYRGVRIYAPHHGNGEDPYSFWPGGTIEQKLKAPGDD